ncbi:sigma factor, partial [Actinoplanes sp. NPDC023801]|uniref:sigma factor n=1 Tax=Actinoplanes sp. NPDC023801 TaxID=3154595 RepID=UPI0033FFD225
MSAVTSPTAPSPAVVTPRAAGTSRHAAHVVPTASASELLAAMAAAPPGPRYSRLRDRAIEAWLPLARHLAHRYSGRGEPTDDLIQTATVGLI